MKEEVILVDCNALADFFVGVSELKGDAEALRRRHPDWVTLPLCRYGFGNVLRTYTRSGKIAEEDALLMLKQGLDMVSFCPEPDEELVFSVANADSLTFYDAGYVACARSMGLPLYTRDGDILRNCPDIARPFRGE